MKNKLDEKKLRLFTFIFIIISFVCIIFTFLTKNESLLVFSFFLSIVFIITGIVFLIKYLIVHIKNIRDKNNILVSAPKVYRTDETSNHSFSNEKTNNNDNISESVNALKNEKEMEVEEKCSYTSSNEEVNTDILSECKNISEEVHEPIEFTDFNYEENTYKIYKTYTEVPIVGSKFHNLPNDIIYGERLCIEHEDNEFDKRAVSIKVFRNDTKILIGYLSKESKLYEMANDYFDKEYYIAGKIDNVEQLTASLGFYKVYDNPNTYSKLSKIKPLKKFSVTLNDEQFISGDKGDEVELYIIDSEHSLLTINFGEEKKLSKSIAEFLSDYSENEIIAFISDIQEIDYDKTKVTISVFERE